MQRSAAAAPQLAGGLQVRVLTVALLGAFVAFLDVTIVNVAFPSIRASFAHTSLPTLSWVLNGYNVAFAALLVPAGRYADSIGHRRSFLIGIVIFMVASACAGAAPGSGYLIAARVVQALGAAIIVPTSLALLLGAFPYERRATAVGLWGASAAVAAASGPALGGLLVNASNWRLVFFVNLPLGLIAVLLVAGLPADVRTSRPVVPDPAGIALVMAATGLLALGIVQGQTWGWTSAAVIGSLVAAAAAAALFVQRTRSHDTPVVDMRLFASRGFAIANLGTLTCAAAFYGMLLNNVLFLTQVWGYSTLKAGLALTPAPLFAAATAGPAGRLADKRGHGLAIFPGALVYAAGAAYLLVRADASASYVTEFLPAAALTGIGIGLAFPTLSAAAVASLDGERFATGSAVNAASRQLGAVLGIAIVVAILTAATGGAHPMAAYQRSWVFAACASALVAPLIVLYPRPARSEA